MLSGLLAACAVAAEPDDDTPSPAVQPGLDGKLEAAADASSVPAPILKAVSYVETRWQNVSSQEHEGVIARFGVMGLDGARLARGAQLAGLTVEAVQTDVPANISAAAALLAEAGAASGATASDLGSWQSAIGTFSGIEDPDGRMEYVAAVYDVLRGGAQDVAESGALIASLAPQAVPNPPRSLIGVASVDYPPAIFRASPNYNSRPAGTQISLVVIHTCEGGYAGCWSHLRSSTSGVSAHYVVKEDGSEITQLVTEANRAWHIAAAYRCSLNGNVDCAKNGLSTNHFSVGIEHGGYARQASFPAGQIEASAKLTCDITRDHRIVRDRNHIVAHGKLQPETRTDPGPNWPWAAYIDRIRTLCSDTPGPGPGGTIIVDSNNANNDAAKAKMEVTGTWTSANGTPGYYGSGYWYAETAPISAPATFWFYLDADATRTVDAWWTAGTNRAPAAPFLAYNAAGAQVGSVAKDQRAAGSQWNTLGTWNFTRGWNRIVLSRWTTTGAVVIADAVRVR
ncbi:MAG: N-acetylmuramoyl-L-alanine amidase [Kofleriaceae bacterium]